MRSLGVALAGAVGWVLGSVATHVLYARAAERAYMALRLPLSEEDYEYDPDEPDFSIDLNPDIPWINGEDDSEDVEYILAIREWLNRTQPGLDSGE